MATKESSGLPTEGAKAPAFELDASNGEKVKLSGLKGKPVILYFYPKDDTPGCTIEAKGFRDHLPQFEQAGAVVLGVSPDGVESHCKFIRKFELNFLLLADTEHLLAEKYGVWVEKNNYGKKYWGVQRSTFLIDGDGRLAKVWATVKPDGHAEEVLQAVKDL